MPENLEEQVLHLQPTTADERAAIAEACVLHLDLEMPMLLDSMEDEVDAKYVALPERLFLIDADGVVTWRSGIGPWAFDPSGWEQAIRRLIEES